MCDAPQINAALAVIARITLFNAAAHKHVLVDGVEHRCDDQRVGYAVVLDAAIQRDVETFVMISTDKAVNPVSVIKAKEPNAWRNCMFTARTLETGHRSVAVRFGNVLGSRGSVVPFQTADCARRSRQVTYLTYGDFYNEFRKRYNWYCKRRPRQGRRNFCAGHGRSDSDWGPGARHDSPQRGARGRDIDIEFTGLGPGEKLFEELFVPGEAIRRTARKKSMSRWNGAKPTSGENTRWYAAYESGEARAGGTGRAGARAVTAIVLNTSRRVSLPGSRIK